MIDILFDFGIMILIDRNREVLVMFENTVITNSISDLSHYDPFIKKMANDIYYHPIDYNNSVNVGLYGKQYSTRASITKRITDEMHSIAMVNDAKTVIFQFEPWNFTTPGELLSQFFKQLLEALHAENRYESIANIGKGLKRCTKWLHVGKYLPVVGDFIDKTTDLLQDVANQAQICANNLKALDEQKKAVLHVLQKQHLKIIVLIDIIDRFNNKQIQLLFEFIKSIVDFPYMIYLVSFDRDVVASALESEQNCGGYEYLEKIIQNLIPIPDTSNEVPKDIT
jgi:predicted KAP-like P-loop ATPase